MRSPPTFVERRLLRAPAPLRFVAALVNPVDESLYEVVALDAWGTRKRLGELALVFVRPSRAFRGHVVGEGYLERDAIDLEGLSLVRSHTPRTYDREPLIENGVTETGRGLGLVLYAGLALAAATYGHDGIYDHDEDRTASANRFWRKQVARGLAERVGDLDVLLAADVLAAFEVRALGEPAA